MATVPFQFWMKFSKSRDYSQRYGMGFFVEAVVSDTLTDAHDDRLSLGCLQKMVNQLKTKNVELLPAHNYPFKFGWSRDAWLNEAEKFDEAGNKLTYNELVAVFELDMEAREGKSLYEQCQKGVCEFGASVYGDILLDSVDWDENWTRIVNDVVLKHVCSTIPEGAAVAGSGFRRLSASISKSLGGSGFRRLLGAEKRKEHPSMQLEKMVETLQKSVDEKTEALAKAKDEISKEREKSSLLKKELDDAREQIKAIKDAETARLEKEKKAYFEKLEKSAVEKFGANQKAQDRVARIKKLYELDQSLAKELGDELLSESGEAGTPVVNNKLKKELEERKSSADYFAKNAQLDGWAVRKSNDGLTVTVTKGDLEKERKF